VWAVTSLMKLNKKGTKVKLDSKYKLVGASGTLIQFGLPFWYVASQFDLFTFKNEQYALTGWGVVILTAGVLASRNKIKNMVTDYNNNMSITAQRAKYGHIFVTIVLILALASVFINGFLWFFGVLAGSNYLSLIPFSIYDKQLEERNRLQTLLDKERDESKVADLKKLQQSGVKSVPV
jgi:hypothetical protein